MPDTCCDVLTERVDHLEALAGGLRAIGPSVVVLRGGMGGKPLKAALARAAEHVPGQVLLATGRFIGEGFDNARLDTLFLTMPVSWRGTIAQYVGRLHRLHEHKQDVRVYDYADLDVPMLARMFDKRCRGYEAVGYSISLPASAAPGWPTVKRTGATAVRMPCCRNTEMEKPMRRSPRNAGVVMNTSAVWPLQIQGSLQMYTPPGRTVSGGKD